MGAPVSKIEATEEKTAEELLSAFKQMAPAERRKPSPQINFSSTEVEGNVGGLIFVVGSVFIVAVGLSSVIWFLFAATAAGCFLAWALVAWHTSHPRRGLPENRIVLR